MTSSNLPIRPDLVGRFVVDLPGERRTGLAAHEVAMLLELPQAHEAVIYRVHRVGEDGRMELVGVAPASFRRQECFAFARRDVRDARMDYDRLVTHAAVVGPPCRIDLRLVRSATAELSAITAIIFPDVCVDAVTHWLNTVNPRPGDEESAGMVALESLDSVQMVKQVILDPHD